jgi:hypothetical protein
MGKSGRGGGTGEFIRYYHLYVRPGRVMDVFGMCQNAHMENRGEMKYCLGRVERRNGI